MDRSDNSFDEINVGALARTGDRSAGSWRQQQQLQHWRLLLQRLGQALAEGNLGQARQVFDALLDDVPETGLPDPLAHPQFAVLGRALQALELENARAAFSHLQHWPSTHQPREHGDSPNKQAEKSANSTDPSAKTSATLDVTA